MGSLGKTNRNSVRPGLFLMLLKLLIQVQSTVEYNQLQDIVLYCSFYPKRALGETDQIGSYIICKRDKDKTVLRSNI